MRIEELEKTLYRLNSSIKDALRASQYESWGDLSGVEYSRKDPQESFLAVEFSGVLEKLEDIKARLDYLQRPIEAKGLLFKGDNGRYTARATETAPDSPIEEWEYTSGHSIEFLYTDPDEDEERTSWRVSRVEYSHEKQDYYIVGYRETQLEGLTVRIRE